ncbi:MAG: hypothetical protein ACI9R3_005831 [Verrucomicrobiales bacterium]|jgi:hypothetical protein
MVDPVRMQFNLTPSTMKNRFLILLAVVTALMCQMAKSELTAPTSVPAGSSFEVAWSGQEKKGRMRMVTADGAILNGGSYKYPSNSKTGTVDLQAPIEAWNYDVIYIMGGEVLARETLNVGGTVATVIAAETVQAGGDIDIQWTGPDNRQDRIVLITAGAEKRDSVISEEPVATMNAPDEPGDYVLHYWTGKGATLATRPIRVTPPPTEPGFLRVTTLLGKGFGENSAIEVILDASGSMLKRQGGKRRIEIAKETLLGLIGDTIPAKTGFALRVFGHKEADSCRTDLEIPLGPLNPAAARATVSSINAMNLAKTPIAASLEKVASDLSGITGERIVIMVTDGEETCDGDPALAIRMLRSIGSDVRVNIVGYSIDDTNLQETFASWATIGGGQYLNAPDADELANAMRQALEIPCQVFDGKNLIATGITGSEKRQLPAGSYQIHYKWDGKEMTRESVVTSKQLTETQLP